MAKLFSLSTALKLPNFTLFQEDRRVKFPADTIVDSIVVDSRKVKKDCLFVALKGEQTDGHLFLGEAVAKGASVLLIQRDYTGTEAFKALEGELNVPILVHEDPLLGLQQLATSWLELNPGILRIGVTGSNGKTTTKEMIAAVLQEIAPTVKNAGNLNSEIGLPIAIFDVRKHHRFGVFEMGVNHAGEMNQLVSVFHPEYGLITNVGTAHIGLLGSREGIALEKGGMFASLPEDGMGFYPEKCEWKDYFSGICRAPMVPFGMETTGGVGKVEDLHLEGWKVEYEGLSIRLKLPGEHNLQNLLATIQLTRSLGATPEQIRRGIESLEPLEGRSQVIEGPVRIIHDSYNANSESMRALLRTVQTGLPLEKLVLVLGSMKELGELAEAAHRELGGILKEVGGRGVFLFGEEMIFTLREAKKRGFSGELRHTNDYTELEEAVRSFVRSGDTVVLKASHSMELERLIPVLQGLKFEKIFEEMNK